MMDRWVTRRNYLRTTGVAALTGLAGCGESGESTAETSSPRTTLDENPRTDTESTPTASETDATESADSWPMIAFDAGNTNQNAAASGFDGEPDRRWRNPWAYEFGGGDGVLPPPLLSEGHLLVEDDSGDVFPIDTESGEHGDPSPIGFQWRRPMVATSEGVYSLGVDRETERLAFAAQNPDGEVRWREPLPARRAVLAGENVYVAVSDDDEPVTGVVALDRSTGQEQWRRTRPVDTPSYVAASEERVFVSSGTVVDAYEPADGERSWGFELPDGVDANLRFGRPKLTADRVLVGSVGPATSEPVPRLWGFPRDGPSDRWTWEDETGIVPRVVTDSVAVGAGRAIDVRSGTESWERTSFVRELLEPGGLTIRDAAASGGTLFLGTGESSGEGGEIGHGAVAALDVELGEPKWQFTVPGGVQHLLVGDGRLFVVTLQGAIEAYE